jgi:hypothetical protein
MFGILIFFMDGMAWVWALRWFGLGLENKNQLRRIHTAGDCSVFKLRTTARN